MLLQTGFTILMLAYYKKLYFIKNPLANCFFIGMVITMITAVFNNVQDSYVSTAVYMTLVAIPAYFAVAYLGVYLKKYPSKWEVIRNALKLMCIIQMVWCLLQFILYKMAEIDLNQIVFVDKLHLLEYASFYKGGEVFMPTALCWHPIIMAPVLTLAYFLFNNIIVKIIVLFESLIVGNSTVLIVVCICVCLDLFHGAYLIFRKGKTQRIVISCLIAAFVLLFLVLGFTHVLDSVFEKLMYVFGRITGGEADASTEAHIRYYTGYRDVLGISNIGQIIFGYGESCSGYPYSQLFGQYRYLANWAVETDIMNILVSRGIVGFLMYYINLLQIIICGRKIDYRYMLFMIAMILAGITYNVQFSWVVFIELMMITAIDQRINFFGDQRNKRKGSLRIVW